MPGIDLTNRRPAEELAKLPSPTNNGLKKLFDLIDCIVIKAGGVYDDKAMRDEILLTILHPGKIAAFAALLEIDENSTGFYCMCSGTYAIELYHNNRMQAIIGFHHNVSIRYSKWNGDAALATPKQLLIFLADEGFTKPLDDYNEQIRQNEPRRVEERKWFDTAPKCFAKYWEQMNGVENIDIPNLTKELNDEIPDRQRMIIKLLQTYGKSKSPWTAYPFYETIPLALLSVFSTKEITEAYLASDRNYKTRAGLGRYLCCFEFKKRWRTQLKYVTWEVVADLKKYFDWAGDEQGQYMITKMQTSKSRRDFPQP